MNRAQMEKAPAQRPITTSKIANKGWIVGFLFSDRKLTSQKLKLQSSNIQYPISNLYFQPPTYLGMSRRAA